MAAKEVVERTSGKTAQTYLNAVLPFFTWPPLGGTEEPQRKRRLSDSYFRIQGDEWLLQIVDDVKLPGLVLTGGNKVKGWGLREDCVTRILFETGGRISEVLVQLRLRELVEYMKWWSGMAMIEVCPGCASPGTSPPKC